MMDLGRFRRREGLAVVLSGPSGVGKDTLLSFFLRSAHNCTRLVTCTTRPKRENELDGVDYFFMSDDEFTRVESEGGMLETAEVYGYKYGSPRKFVDEKRHEGLNVILKLDVQGGLAAKEAIPESIMVFLAPPSMEELERRLRERRSETAEQLERRLSTAQSEMELIPHYHYLIIHDTTEAAARELDAIITAETSRVITNGR